MPEMLVNGVIEYNEIYQGHHWGGGEGESVII